MQNIFDIHDYDENFLDQFVNNTIPIYDLWSIRPLQNEQREHISGKCDEILKFRNFISDHSAKEFPHPLVIVVGNCEKANPGSMLNSTKKYFKIKFDKFKGNDLGTPLMFGTPQPYPMSQEQMIPLGFGGYGQRPPAMPMPGYSISDIQGIIDRNVTDATRSIKAGYEESAARREAESIRRIADLEMKMELYKLDLRAREVEEKERQLREEMEDFDRRKAEGLGSVKEYTKTIAGGLLELGKSAFGIDQLDKKSKSKDEPVKELKGASSKSSLNDDGFEEQKSPEEKTDSFKELACVVAELSEEQKMQLLDILMPDDSQNEEKTESNNQNKSEENEDIPSEHND
ncbi:MAG: hypothetical protein A2W91_05560 [Bacteroidetes bacterium GWF2_38_335]|nr:MAG: hypothetical protein A2W91_05560 [Bacteroidetes bacterium GWF2_38_335]HBS88089.1 hypothetical protein [Bacteroidales bacterium]